MSYLNAVLHAPTPVSIAPAPLVAKHAPRPRQVSILEQICDFLLPHDRRGLTPDDLLRLGFLVGDPADDLVGWVRLPAGWTVQPCEVDYWTRLFDEEKRVRAMIFHKVRSDKRQAFVDFARRYSYRIQAADGYLYDDDPQAARRWVLTDAGEAFYESRLCRLQPGERLRTLIDRLDQEATGYLDRSLPGWREARSYWDD